MLYHTKRIGSEELLSWSKTYLFWEAFVLADGTIRTTQLIRNDARTPLGRVTLAGFIKDSAGVQGKARVLGSYALVYLLEGSGFYRDVQGHGYRVGAGDLLVIFPEIGHTYGPEAGEHWSEFYCVFDGPAFDLLRDIGMLDADRPVVHLAPVASWLARLQAALPSQTANTLAERTIMISRFVQLVTEIAAVSAVDAATAAPAWIAEACRLLRDQLDRDIRPSDVAAQLGVPYETFRKRFQQHVGVSPGRYRVTRRIDAACGLLLETNLTTQAIAARLGFADAFHFSRRFKQVTGLTPRDFRQRLPRAQEQSS
jgi:AraC-like DNA-binding protein